MPTLSDFTAQTLDGREQDLGEYAGKVVLVVNTASQCGFTPQFGGLERLWDEYGDDGLVVLGFPCNQFGSQDPGSDERDRRVLPGQLRRDVPDVLQGRRERRRAPTRSTSGSSPRRAASWATKIKWNFTKFLVGRDGQVIKRFGSTTKPEKIAPKIEKALAAPVPQSGPQDSEKR